jgi:hypothetical protein
VRAALLDLAGILTSDADIAAVLLAELNYPADLEPGPEAIAVRLRPPF